MAGRLETHMHPDIVQGNVMGVKSYGTLDADIIIANAPDPVFVSDLAQDLQTSFAQAMRMLA